jgi:hypothetical protein
MGSLFINKDTFGEYVMGFIKYALLKVSSFSLKICFLQYDVGY